jgi:hypothetical protein
MYYLYEVTRTSEQTRFIRVKEAHLFGRNVGEIPRLLRQHLHGSETEPYPWYLPVETMLDPKQQTLIIDLKPNNKDPKAALSLYELRDVWGFSAYGWTPSMVRIRGISVDGDPPIDDPADFSVELFSNNDSIYTFLHFEGTVRGGALVGPWTAPRRSSTNSALLWPYAVSYFFQQIRQTTPQVLELRVT